MSPEEFYDKCASHDWYHAYSDDHNVWRRGEAAEHELRKIAATDERLQSIFDQWRDHMFTGEAYGSERAPKPERPA